MKIFRAGKEVKNASVIYTPAGMPSMVNVDGVNMDLSAFELKDEKPVKKTKDEVNKANDSVMTTENTGIKKK